MRVSEVFVFFAKVRETHEVAFLGERWSYSGGSDKGREDSYVFDFCSDREMGIEGNVEVIEGNVVGNGHSGILNLGRRISDSHTHVHTNHGACRHWVGHVCSQYLARTQTICHHRWPLVFLLHASPSPDEVSPIGQSLAYCCDGNSHLLV